MENETFGPVYQKILDMAQKHGVSYASTPIDVMAETVSHLSDNELAHNDATRAIVAMCKGGVLSTMMGDLLFLDLMEEMGVL